MEKEDGRFFKKEINEKEYFDEKLSCDDATKNTNFLQEISEDINIKREILEDEISGDCLKDKEPFGVSGVASTSDGKSEKQKSQFNRKIGGDSDMKQSKCCKKPFSCDICTFSSTSKSILTRHMGTHTGKKPYSCDLCEYSCIRKSSLNRHMRTHTGEKPFSCDVCEYSCAEKSHLKRHMRTHTGEKPFSCDLCPFSCVRKSNLNVHIRTHTGEKPYSCNWCTYSCAQKSNLNVHIRTHSDDNRLGL